MDKDWSNWPYYADEIETMRERREVFRIGAIFLVIFAAIILVIIAWAAPVQAGQAGAGTGDYWLYVHIETAASGEWVTYDLPPAGPYSRDECKAHALRVGAQLGGTLVGPARLDISCELSV